MTTSSVLFLRVPKSNNAGIIIGVGNLNKNSYHSGLRFDLNFTLLNLTSLLLGTKNTDDVICNNTYIIIIYNIVTDVVVCKS